MNIVSVGREFPLKTVVNIKFRSDFTLLDYDLALWDPSTLVYEYHYTDHYRGYPNLNSHDSVAIIEDGKRRSNEILDLIKLGRTVIIFVPPPAMFYIDTGQRTYSGTGRSQKTTIHVTDKSIRSFIPIKGDFNTVEAKGTQIDFRGDDIFRPFWEANKDNIYYKAYFTHPIGHPFLFIHGTDRIIASWLRFERGNILLLPHLPSEEHFTRKTDYSSASKVFIETLVELVMSIQKEVGDFSLPKWTLNYKIPGEETIEEEIASIEGEQQKNRRSLESKRTELSILQRYKLLFSAKGNSLHTQVIEVLKELGIDAKPGPAGRDDVILSFEGVAGVAEVKGTNKSAAEAHAAQLEKWVSEYFADHGIKPKGFLIINPFHDIPLAQRNEEPFPNQMLKYCTNREHCLVTTTKLLGLLLSTRNTPDERLRLLRTLFCTVGVFRGFEDFNSFLSVGDTGESETEEAIETKDGELKTLE